MRTGPTSLVEIARENLEIFERGRYAAPSGREVSIEAPLAHAVNGTRLYQPSDLEAPFVGQARPMRVEVTPETTGAALRRLVQDEGEARVVALNFASAKNPGGGFLTGARAQEEDLARCSGLYPCLIRQQAYYQANRAFGSLLYTDHIIYSPDVPFFRDEGLGLLDAPFLASLITAPAPNAGEHLRRHPDAGEAIRACLRRRALEVLRVATEQRHRCVILGAWGCGVFRNDPAVVADAFAGALAAGPPFERVVFAVYDTARGQRTLGAFRERFTLA